MIYIIYSASCPGLQFTMRAMIVEFLNVGLPRKEHFPDKEVVTGICKAPVTGPLRLGKTGFAGVDGVGDEKHHGGPDKAVCVYSLDHYPYWENVLGSRLAPAPSVKTSPSRTCTRTPCALAISSGWAPPWCG